MVHRHKLHSFTYIIRISPNVSIFSENNHFLPKLPKHPKWPNKLILRLVKYQKHMFLMSNSKMVLVLKSNNNIKMLA